MDLDDVRQLDTTLQDRGETISANRIVAELDGSKRDVLRLLRQYRAETQPTAAGPPAAEAPLPLLTQAEVLLEHATDLTAEQIQALELTEEQAARMAARSPYLIGSLPGMTT